MIARVEPRNVDILGDVAPHSDATAHVARAGPIVETAWGRRVDPMKDARYPIELASSGRDPARREPIR